MGGVLLNIFIALPHNGMRVSEVVNISNQFDRTNTKYWAGGCYGQLVGFKKGRSKVKV